MTISMACKFSASVLRTVVSQICQNIGFSSLTVSSLDILVDIAKNFLFQLAQRVHRYAELSGRSNTDLTDVELTFEDMGINISQFQEYVSNVGLQPFSHKVAAYPVPREASFQFLDQNSNETTIRPSHVPDYLPPMNLTNQDYRHGQEYSGNESPKSFKLSTEPSIIEIPNGKDTRLEEDHTVRVMSTITMNSAGMIISSKEGQLPELRLKSPVHVPLPVTQNLPEKENLMPKKTNPAAVDSNKFSSSQHFASESSEFSKASVKSKTPAIKFSSFKKKVKSSVPSSSGITKANFSGKKDSDKDKKKNKTGFSRSKGPPTMPALFSDPMEKLPTLDVDRQKLNIFKKMITSKVREETANKVRKDLPGPLLEHKKVTSGNSDLSKSNLRKDKKDKKKGFSKDKQETDVTLSDRVSNVLKNANEKQAQDIDDTISAVIGMTHAPHGGASSALVSSKASESHMLKNMEDKNSERKRKLKEAGGRERAKLRKGVSPRRIGAPSSNHEGQNSSKEMEPLDMRKSPIFSKLPSHPTFIPNPNILQNPVFGMLPTFPYTIPGSPSIPFAFPNVSNSIKPALQSQGNSAAVGKSKNRTGEKSRSSTKESLNMKVDRMGEQKSERMQKDLDEKKEKSKDSRKHMRIPDSDAEGQDKGDANALPKITFKFGSGESQDSAFSHAQDGHTKIVIKAGKKTWCEDSSVSADEFMGANDEKMETQSPGGSPELARFAALTHIDSSKTKGSKMIDNDLEDKGRKGSGTKGNKKVASKGKKKDDAELITETVGLYIDEHGNKVWICPGCGKQDDGSPMIGCDGCDDWYHWVCVGIQVPPADDENWYCKKCTVRKQSTSAARSKSKKRK